MDTKASIELLEPESKSYKPYDNPGPVPVPQEE